MENLTEKELLEIYDIVFNSIHSNGFKTSEIKTLLFDKEYWFLELPKENWKDNLRSYFNNIDYNKSKLNINPLFNF